MELKNSELKSIEEFEKSFSDYCKAFREYYLGGLGPSDDYQNEYKLGHPDLYKFASEIQACFLNLHETIRKRLLHIDFEWFIHCNNPVDFYNFRRFLIQRDLLAKTLTISERIFAELSLAKLLAKKEILERYSELPERNFEFYLNQDEFKPFSKEETNKVNDSNGICCVNDSRIPENNENIFNEITQKTEQIEKIAGSTKNIVGSFADIIRFLIKIKTGL